MFGSTLDISNKAALITKSGTREIELIWSDGRQAGVRFVN